MLYGGEILRNQSFRKEGLTWIDGVRKVKYWVSQLSALVKPRHWTVVDEQVNLRPQLRTPYDMTTEDGQTSSQ